MQHCSLKKTLGATLAAIALTAGFVSAAPPASAVLPSVDAEAQLDVMAASGIVQEEINGLYHTWDSILKSGMAERSHYTFYVAVTDLDRDGRLELLISRHFLNRDPLYYAGDSIAEEQKKNLQDLCENYPSEVYGAAYEISADGTTLEPLEIQTYHNQFPDFTRLHIKGKRSDFHYNYDVDTQRMPRDESWTSATDRYGIVCDAQMIWTDVFFGVGTIAHKEGTIRVDGEETRPHYTSMKIISTHQDLDPYGIEAEAFERARQEHGGRRVSFVTWEELEKDTRAALASSWQGWSYEDQ